MVWLWGGGGVVQGGVQYWILGGFSIKIISTLLQLLGLVWSCMPNGITANRQRTSAEYHMQRTCSAAREHDGIQQIY